MISRLLLPALALSLIASPARAENILITNDDGLTSNVKALYDALKAAGHDVIVSVPCQGQSGMGAAAKFMRPLSPLAADCLHGAAKKGDPGAGPMTRAGFERDFYYVDGTPVMATLYGIDVVAAKRWGRAPDLILSGPNEGQNVGLIVISSGTVSNTQYGTARGIPSVALSAGTNSTGDAALANPQSVVVAGLSVRLVDTLLAGKQGGRILPPGVALNVNFPDKLEGAHWQVTRIGTYQTYEVTFAQDLGSTPAAQAFGLKAAGLPGIALGFNRAAPDKSQSSDESVVYKTAIAVSPMQLGYEPQGRIAPWIRSGLPALVKALNQRGKAGSR